MDIISYDIGMVMGVCDVYHICPLSWDLGRLGILKLSQER
jgi:hypothetical protein